MGLSFALFPQSFKVVQTDLKLLSSGVKLNQRISKEMQYAPNIQTSGFDCI